MAENKKSGKARVRTLTGAQAIMACLEAEDVRYVFGCPGAQAADFFAALEASSLVAVQARHEQGAVHEADGYARATGQVGTVLVSSGAGAANTVTGIATAYMDSIPLVVIAAQVPTDTIGSDSFQETDIVGITMPVVKHSFLVQSADELPLIMKHAFHIARTGRPGPVLVDVPSDIAAQTVSFKYPATVNLPSYKPTVKPNARQVRAAAERILAAQRPVLYVGGGAVSSGASAEVRALAELVQLPVVTTLMGLGAFPSDHELALGMAGPDGCPAATDALVNADLIIAAGARFSDRIAAVLDQADCTADIIHIDIDPAEIGRVREACVPIVGDLKRTLQALVEALCERTASPDSNPSAAEEAASLEASLIPGAAGEPLALEASLVLTCETLDGGSPSAPDMPKDAVSAGQHNAAETRAMASPASPAPDWVMDALALKLDADASIVAAEDGRHLPRTCPRTFLTSGALGARGFAFPAAVGAALGCPDKQVVCVASASSFQMNVQEMATAAAYQLPVKVIVSADDVAGPDFVKLAQAYGWQAEGITRLADASAAFDRLLAAEGPCLLDTTAVASLKEA